MLKFSPLCYRGDRAVRALDDRALERETEPDDVARDRELIDEEDDRPLLKDEEDWRLGRVEDREELPDDGVYALLDRDELVLGL